MSSARTRRAIGLNLRTRPLVSQSVRQLAASFCLIAWVLLARFASAQPAADPPTADPPPGGEGRPERPAAPDTWGSGEPDTPTPQPHPADEDLPTVYDEAEGASPRPGVRAASENRASVRYVLEGIEIRGNTRTRSRVVLRYVPFKTGDVIDVDDPEVELTRYRLLGTGFFRDVQFSLRKGSERGHVILVIEVVERNTIIINDLWMGLSSDADTDGERTPLTAYAGLDAAETNLAGSGITLGGAVGLAQDQLALRVRFLDPAFLGSRWLFAGSLLFNDAQDFFGNDDVLYVDENQRDRVRDFATVRYKRFGGSLGVGKDLSVPTQLWLTYRLEAVDATLPQAASHKRGRDREPLLFDIQPGRSVLSTLRTTLQHDSRDQPILPTRGWFLSVSGEVGLSPLGSNYEYQRLDVSASRWWQLPWDHVVRLELFGGAIAGDAPFFEQYYVGDFSDFLAGRVLGLNFDRRPPPNFLGTSIIEVRRGHYAAKIGGEYRIPLYRGHRAVYGIDLFASAGVFGVAGRRDVIDPPTGYSGAARIPVDLTGNVGFRMDTSAGGFAFAFSNVIGFLPVRKEDRPQ